MEFILGSGGRLARLTCPADMIPAPGQYLLAQTTGSDSPLPVPIFAAGSSPTGFVSAPPIPEIWSPGLMLFLRGPLGHGFRLPSSARRVALIACDDSPARLLGLVAPALGQGAEVTLVGDAALDDLPADVEVQPSSALVEVCAWADYAAFDATRESLPGVRQRLEIGGHLMAPMEAEVLVLTPMPCGALADCGVCAIIVKHGWKMACKDGPVFDLRDLH